MFIFYDTETSGLERDFSQILQIALVFTDDNLNILSQTKLECRRSPWVVPAPGALLTTGFVPNDLKNNPYSHYEMMAEVDKWIRDQRFPVIFAGYNTIGYDEPVVAQNFHQNLLNPNLTTEDKNGRFDVMTLVKACIGYAPGVLKLETQNEYGSISVSLVNVAEQNGVKLGADDAHDAMNDIRATIGVAKLIQKAAPQIWDQMIKMSSSDGVDDFIAQNKLFSHTIVSYGKSRSAIVTKAEDGILFDLSVDPTPYLTKTPEELKEILAQKNPQPFRTIDKTAQPILMPMDLSDPVIPAGFDDNIAAARAELIANDAHFRQNLLTAKALLKKPQTTAKLQPEQMIDQSLTPGTQKKLEKWLQDFNHAPAWKAKAALIDGFYTRFSQELVSEPQVRRFVQFAGRIVYEHAPQELAEDKNIGMKRYIAARLLNPDANAPYMTIGKARAELEQIETDRAAGKKWQHNTDSEIRALKLYYTALEKEYAPYLPQKSAHSPDNPAPPAPSKPGPQP